MASSQRIGSFRPLTFLHSGKPVRPYRPQGIDRTASSKGIRMSGGETYTEFRRNAQSVRQLSPRELGAGAVRLQKQSGISVNTTI